MKEGRFLCAFKVKKGLPFVNELCSSHQKKILYIGIREKETVREKKKNEKLSSSFPPQHTEP